MKARARSRLGSVWIAWIGLAFIGSSVESAESRGSPLVTIPGVERGGIIALANGGLLLWNDNGFVQTSSPAGVWGRRISLGFGLEDMVRDPEGALLSGLWIGGTGDSIVLLLGFNGEVRARWIVHLGTSVASGGGRRWGTTLGEGRPRDEGDLDIEVQSLPMSDRLVELLDRSEVADRGALEMDAHIAAIQSGVGGEVRIDCTRKGFYEMWDHPAFCAAHGEAEWRKAGRWDRLPFSCDAYLIEIYSGDFGAAKPRRGRAPWLTVRRLANGEVAADRQISAGPAVACGAPGELLVGRTDVQGWSLPDLKPLWKSRIGGGRVTALARVGDQVFVSTASGSFSTLRKPVQESANASHR